MAQLQAKLILEMVDRVTAPAKGVQRTIDNLNRQVRATQAQADAVRGKMIEAGAAVVGFGYAVSRPIQSFAKFETTLESLAQKVNLPQEKIGELTASIREISDASTTGDKAVAGIVNTLIGAGASLEQSLDVATPIAKAAFAYRISADELSSAVWAAVNNLKVPAGEAEKVIDIMSHAGKAGAFEIADMASYLPQMAAAYQGLGQTGTAALADIAAAAQVVRTGTGDSSSAATNLQNVMQKIYAPATIKKFADKGVDVFAEMEKAAARGLTPIEAIAELTEKTLGGDLSKIGFLFEDAQVQSGLRSIIQNMGEYRRVRKEAMEAAGVSEADYARQLNTVAGRIDLVSVAGERLATVTGEALAPSFKEGMSQLHRFMRSLEGFIVNNRELVAGIVKVTGALLSFRFAMLGLRLLGLTGKAGLLSGIASGLSAVSAVGRGVGGVVAGSFAAVSGAAASASRSLKAFRIVAALEGVGVASGRAVKSLIGNLLGLLNPIRLVKAAMVGLRYALIGSGIGIALLGIGAAGAFIARNWSGIKEMMSNVWTSFQTAIEPVKAKIDPVITALRDVWKWVWSLTGEVDASGKSWAAWGQTIGTWVGNTVTAVANGVQKIIDLIAKLNSAMSSFNPNLAPGAEFRSSPIGTVRKGSFLDKVTPGGTPSPAAPYSAMDIPQAKATGGFMRAVPTLVGERGPEMIYPSRAGWVAHAQQVSRMADVSRRLPQAQQALRMADVSRRLPQAQQALQMADVSRRLPQARSMPSPARQSASARPVNVTFGSINIQGGTSASPRQLADEFGRQVRAQMRSHFSDEF